VLDRHGCGNVSSRPPASVSRSGSAAVAGSDTAGAGGSTTTRANPTDADFRTRGRFRADTGDRPRLARHQ